MIVVVRHWTEVGIAQHVARTGQHSVECTEVLAHEVEFLRSDVTPPHHRTRCGAEVLSRQPLGRKG